MPEFTIPVIIDPDILKELAEIKSVVEANYEAIEELKKIKMGTGLAIGVDLDEVTE